MGRSPAARAKKATYVASKKYKSKQCVYCARTDLPTEREHVLAREFVLEGTPVKEWPSAPSCRACNGEKARLERYVIAALTFTGRHADALETLERNGARRLRKNPELQAAMLKRSLVWVRERGIIVPTWSFDIDQRKFAQLCRMLAKGLAWHHWRVVLGPDCFVEAHWPLVGVRRLEFLKLRGMRAARLTGAVGNDTFVYDGAQGTDNPQVMVWEFLLCGGQPVAGDLGGRIGVMTGPQRVQDRAELRSHWLRNAPASLRG